MDLSLIIDCFFSYDPQLWKEVSHAFDEVGLDFVVSLTLSKFYICYWVIFGLLVLA